MTRIITIDKRENKSCCGKKHFVWKLNIPLKKEHLEIFNAAGFPFLKSFFDAGMLYIEDNGLVASGVFGLNELKIKCKNKNCQDSAKLLEKTILTKL